jgi:hypothetical protein
VAGLAASGTAAFGDQVIYRNTTSGGSPVAGAWGVESYYLGKRINAITPTDPLSITGFNIQVANATGTTISATTELQITAWVWDSEDIAAVSPAPAFVTLLGTETFGTGPVGAAWPTNSFLTFSNPNITLPSAAFTTPITGLTNTEMGWTFSIRMNDGAGGTTFSPASGLQTLLRYNAGAGPTVGAGGNGFYASTNHVAGVSEDDGNFWADDYYWFGNPSFLSFDVYNSSTAPVPLGISDAGTNPATPLASCDGTGMTLLVDVTPGTLPASTGITVVADTTALGGTPGVSLFDDGLNGDGAAGDNEFGVVTQLPPGPEVGLNVPFVVSDAQARTASGTMVVNRDTYAALPADIAGGGSGSNTISGVRTGNDDDMFAVCVSDPNTFAASCVGGCTWDSQLFLFDSAGLGVLHNDDDPNDLAGTTPQSNITGVPLASGGLYYLLITGWNRDPMSLGNQLIWNDDDGAGNYNTVRAPDGTGAANPILLYLGQGNAGGAYTITLTGANAVCPGDLADSTGAAKPDCAVDINDLLFFLAGFEAGDVAIDLTDPSFGSPDCAVDVNDLLFMLAHFEAGC